MYVLSKRLKQSALMVGSRIKSGRESSRLWAGNWKGFMYSHVCAEKGCQTPTN